MPLLHQDNTRGGGGPAEKRRSLAEILELNTTHLSEPASAPARARSFVQDSDNEWRWEEPGSPEVAQTPRALVPPGCFPPRHSTSFGSYSERARPGGWDDGQGITDLVASLALAVPASSRGQTSQQPRLSYDGIEKMIINGDFFRCRCDEFFVCTPSDLKCCSIFDTVELYKGIFAKVYLFTLVLQVEPPWPPEQPREAPSRADFSLLPRRASFCGVVEPHGVVSGDGDSLCWSGTLPPRAADPPGGWSPKVFVGGLPWDITEHALLQALRPFAPVRVEWPGREAGTPLRGFGYVTFESERRVRALLAASRRDRNDWYFRIACRKRTTKDAQVIPWAVADSSWVAGGAARLEQSRTVFVGALHGMLSARALAIIMNDLFSGVVYAGIDTDKNKYPIGSGRVSFGNARSYVRAIAAAYVTIRTPKFSKKVQVDPYLEDSMCSMCNLQQGPYFCKEPVCFRYFCRSCWAWQHAGEEHRPLMRSSAHRPPRDDFMYGE
ncbi:cytoplasmic polyadenylation element-binding protein 1 [Cydia pomonella]|uniref:cytoplasmic polyadenylation element-binding protein 1 n=1 Tax=Cydia pomonella TaxID=82600 RepID=UPI002ADE0748|nr:cytoplasmic polyadenylation element-binding protein 1 [Cydia pomonella]